MKYAKVIGMLLLIGILMIIRWVFQAVYFILIIPYTITEAVINGATNYIIDAQKVNNELLTKDK